MFVSSFQVQSTEFKEARNEEGGLFCFGLQFTEPFMAGMSWR